MFPDPETSLTRVLQNTYVTYIEALIGQSGRESEIAEKFELIAQSLFRSVGSVLHAANIPSTSGDVHYTFPARIDGLDGQEFDVNLLCRKLLGSSNEAVEMQPANVSLEIQRGSDAIFVSTDTHDTPFLLQCNHAVVISRRCGDDAGTSVILRDRKQDAYKRLPALEIAQLLASSDIALKQEIQAIARQKELAREKVVARTSMGTVLSFLSVLGGGGGTGRRTRV